MSESEKERLISDSRRQTNVFRDYIPLRFWNELLTAAGISASCRWADASKGSLRKLLQLVHSTVFQIEGKGEFKEKYVTAGEIALSDMCLKSFEANYRRACFSLAKFSMLTEGLVYPT